jgi:hypothetical protein
MQIITIVIKNDQEEKPSFMRSEKILPKLHHQILEKKLQHKFNKLSIISVPNRKRYFLSEEQN